MMLQAVAHDVKNLLAELALRIQLTDPHAAALAHAAADKLTQVLLLDNPDQLIAHIDAASPTDLLADLAAEYGQRFPDKRISCDCSDAPVLWYYDIHLLRLAVANLVHNALQHCQHAVTLRAYLEDDRLVIEVRDDGAGFSSRLMQHDWQVPLASTKQHGTGMGLMLAHKIAQAHVLDQTEIKRGELRLHTAQGAVVRLIIP
jgi:signal transduction histidine kinase